MTVSPSSLCLLVDGQAVPADGPTLAVVDPATEQVIAHVPDTTPEQLDHAVSAAAAAFGSWSATAPSERHRIVRRLGAVLRANVDELAVLLTTEQGKPLASARAEVERSATWCDGLADIDVPWDVVTETDTHVLRKRRLPLGVVAAIVPWNFPVSLAFWKIAAALLTGNTVVVKPSPFTPLTMLRIGELIADEVPAGVVNVVTGGHSLGPALTADPRVAKIAFTGSTATGRKVMETASRHLTRVTLELGGNDAAVVLPDADLDEVAPKVFWACFQNSSQYCLAAKRVYVHDDVYDEFAAKVREIAAGVRVGNGLDAGVGMGPIQNRAQYESVLALIDECRAAGLDFLIEPHVPDGPGFFVHPTIVDDPPEDSTIVREEPFGPIVPFLRFTTVDEVVGRINASEYGLGGSVWGRDVAAAERVAEQIRSGVVWVNEVQRLEPLFPLSGLKQSGIGSENGLEGLLSYTDVQVISVVR